MSLFSLPYPTFSVGRNTATADTAFTKLIPPYPGPGLCPFLYAVDGQNQPNWMRGPSAAWTHVSRVMYTTGTTLHQLGLMRPFNWTTVSSAATAAQAVINITADPGVYTTNYRYPVAGLTPSSSGLYAYPGRVANNAIAGSDYCAYQLTDGTWVLDTVSSVSTLAITMTNNVPTGGVAAGAPFFFFGVIGDSDPATGAVNFQWDTVASTGNEKFDDGSLWGWFQALHPGDPVLFYSPNNTAAGKLSSISGVYARH